MPSMFKNPMSKKDIENMFTYHSPDEETRKKYDNIRTLAKSFAVSINALCPADSEAKRNALSRLREAAMWANAAISEEAESK